MPTLSSYAASSKATATVKKQPKIAISGNGNIQAKHTKKEELINIILSSFFMDNTFYTKGSETLKTLQALVNNLVEKQEIDFLFNLALYSRRDIGMRTMSMVLIVHTLKSMADANFAYPVGTYQRIAKCFLRIDDMTEIMAYAIGVFGSIKKVPKVLSKAVAKSLVDTGTAYNLAKYNRQGDVNLKFLILHSHPKPKDEEQSKVFKALLEGTLAPADTHEVAFSTNGQKSEDKRSEYQIWKGLWDTKSLPYMATIKSLVRISKAVQAEGTEEALQFLNAIAGYVSNEQQVKRGKQFPFNYFIAARMLEKEVTMAKYKQPLINALNAALEVAVDNIPDIGDKVWVIVDNSGSMRTPLNKNTLVLCNEVAALFGAMVSKAVRNRGGEVCVTAFATNAVNVNFNDSPKVLTRTETLVRTNVGGGTDLGRAINMKSQIGFEPDTVIVLSDMQVNRLHGGGSTSFVRADCKKIAFNLAGNGSTPLHSTSDWQQLYGYSDNIFKFLEASKNVKSIKHALSQPDFA